MPAIQVASTTAAGAQNPNVFTGSAFEFSRGRQLVSVGANAGATGTFISLNSGADVILEEAPPFEAASFPIVPDQMYYNDIMESGDRLRLSHRNPTGAGVTLRAMALLTSV